MWSSSVLILEEEKIQAGVRRVATEDHLLMCRSYEVLQNAKINTSHILLALPFLCPSPQPDLKKKITKNSTAVPSGSHLLDLHPQKHYPMEAVGEKCSFRGKIWLCKWDTSKVVLTEQEMSWRQWDLVRQAIRSWETSCMVKRAVRSFTATSVSGQTFGVFAAG